MKILTRASDKILFSEVDSSINRVRHIDLSSGESVETRIVQRNPDTMILYLSTAKSCHLSCRFCFLTQTKQTNNSPLVKNEFEDQMDWIVEQLKDDPRVPHVSCVHINLMARGDCMANKALVENYREFQKLVREKVDIIFPKKCIIKFKLSTIFPEEFMNGMNRSEAKRVVNDLVRTNEYGETEIYYSLYSLRAEFRKRWLPKATHYSHVGSFFYGHRPYGDVSTFRLHHALIDGENTSDRDVELIHGWLDYHNIVCGINLVSYNPFDGSSGKEPDEDTIERYASKLRGHRNVAFVQRVSKVAKDSFASCGMFVSDNIG